LEEGRWRNCPAPSPYHLLVVFSSFCTYFLKLAASQSIGTDVPAFWYKRSHLAVITRPVLLLIGHFKMVLQVTKALIM
jgi:hypothetical protein